MSEASRTTVANFTVDFLQFIDEQHQLTQPLPAFADPETLLKMYRDMSLTRALDNKAIKLQRTGQMGTYPSSQGQEAIGVGIGHGMKPVDIFCPYYRDQGTFLVRGVKASEILAYWGGDERGSDFTGEHCRDDFPVCVPIAGQCLHAAGVAFAVKYRQQQRAVVTICGEGGTSKGDFYEAMNLAGTWQLPLVFIVNNNQWAISVPRGMQTGAQTIAQKAIAAGFKGHQVDGNDIVAVTDAIQQATAKARDGGGPTLIEALSYRLCDHTTADDANRYRPADELKDAWKKEPVARLGYYLEAEGLWSRDKESELQKTITEEVDAAVDEYLNYQKPKNTDMFDYLYAKLPEALYDQRDELGENV